MDKELKLVERMYMTLAVARFFVKLLKANTMLGILWTLGRLYTGISW